jgi:hypothetical protein
MSPGSPAPTNDLVLSVLAHRIVMALEPDQEALLEGVTDRWRAGREGGGTGSSGGSVGFGVDPSVLSEVVYPVIVGTFAQVLGSAAFEALRDAARKRLRRRRVPVPDVVVPVDDDLVARIRKACEEQGIAEGMTAEDAARLAEAMAEAIRKEPPDPEPGG